MTVPIVHDWDSETSLCIISVVETGAACCAETGSLHIVMSGVHSQVHMVSYALP